MDDLGFVQNCVTGDKQAWCEFVDRYSRLIYSYIYNTLKASGARFEQDIVADIYQDIFVFLRKDDFYKLKTYRAKNGCTLASWLRHVVIHYTIDSLRKTRPAVSLDQEDQQGYSLKDSIASQAEGADELVISSERMAQLSRCIEELNSEDRYFIELHINRGINLEALKSLFNASRGAIDMRKSRIINRLKECFKSKGFLLDY